LAKRIYRYSALLTVPRRFLSDKYSVPKKVRGGVLAAFNSPEIKGDPYRARRRASRDKKNAAPFIADSVGIIARGYP
jgi:hypothetical protein